MKIINGIHEWTKKKKPVVIAMGMFDGVHIGHMNVIREAEELARELGALIYVVTFDIHPRNLLYHDGKLELLSVNTEKIAILEKTGIDGILFLYFNKNTADMEPRVFFEKELINKIGATGIVVGQNFRFGKEKLGDVDLLDKLCSEHSCILKSVPLAKNKGIVISSTKIKEYLTQGLMQDANECLGRPYSCTGKVIKGLKLGRRFDVPTVNIHIAFGKFVPKGVFYGYVEVNSKKYQAVINSGTRPTIDESCDKVSLEAHILNFNKDLYGKEVRIIFKDKIRDEKRFDSIEELFDQIHKDIEGCLRN